MKWKLGLTSDQHLKGNGLRRKLQCVTWAQELFLEQGVVAEINAGDIFEQDQVGDQKRTVGAIKSAYVAVLAPLLDHYLLEGNHDRHSPSRGSALLLFDHPRIHTITEPAIKSIRDDSKHVVVVIVFMPWQYSTAWVTPEERASGQGHELFTDRVDDRLCGLHEAARLMAEEAGGVPVLLCAHGRVSGAKNNQRKKYTGGTGFELRRPTVGLFDHAILGDLHLRQQELDGIRGGYVGALTQEGQDEEGNPSGVEVLTWEDGAFTSEWFECPCARRYATIHISPESKLSGDFEIVKPDDLTCLRVKYVPSDNSDEQLDYRMKLAELATWGIRLEREKCEVASKTRLSAEQAQRGRRITEPAAALDFYGEVTQMPAEELSGLQEELTTLLQEESDAPTDQNVAD